MTPFEDLTQSERAAILTARAEQAGLHQVQASAFSSPAYAEPRARAAFNAGIERERKRHAFADYLRTAVARRLQNRAVGSRDAIAVALLEAEEPEIKTEVVLPLRKVELTKEQQAFADAITAKINRTLRPEARR
jgi:hypothetical protein